MSKIEQIDLHQPLPRQLLEALRALALPTLVAFTLAHYLDLLPAGCRSW